MNWRSETTEEHSVVTKGRFIPRVRSAHKGERGMLLPWLPAVDGRSIGPERLPRWSVGKTRLIYAPSQLGCPGQSAGAWNSNYYCSQPIPLGAGRMHSAGRYWLCSWWGVKACPLQPTQQELLPRFITTRPASFIPLPLSCQIEWLR